MKRGAALFLMTSVFLIGIPILGYCIFLFPWMAKEVAEANPELAYLHYPVFIGLYATSIPFFLALYQSIKLFSYARKNKAFSELYVKVLKNIKYCAITISILYVAGMPHIIFMGDKDDSPGIVLFGLLVIIASIVIAVFTAVHQKQHGNSNQ